MPFAVAPHLHLVRQVRKADINAFYRTCLGGLGVSGVAAVVAAAAVFRRQLFGGVAGRGRWGGGGFRVCGVERRQLKSRRPSAGQRCASGQRCVVVRTGR